MSGASLSTPLRPATGRYALESELARGGMGVVYKASDRLAEREVAYKRLLVPKGRDRARFIALFQREYNTLAQLTHPGIVSAYEFGFDDEGPFYTMELIAGNGLAEAAPLSTREACRILRDVASSLALLHARRMLHRDLSPANVRIQRDGRTKLIDFGALMRFGPAPDVVGTPGFMAPECLTRDPLDQRADLYALGALLYWALTRKTAVVARSLHELPAAWEQPIVPPSQHAAGVPAALDELVLSLLSRDPLARPASAAEVIERLTAIAELEPEPEARRVAASYTENAPLVGRALPLARFDAALRELPTHGHSFVLDAEHGLGRSALLDNLVVHAQLAGATVLRADASSDATPYGLARTLVRTALAHFPDLRSEVAGRD